MSTSGHDRIATNKPMFPPKLIVMLQSKYQKTKQNPHPKTSIRELLGQIEIRVQNIKNERACRELPSNIVRCLSPQNILLSSQVLPKASQTENHCKEAGRQQSFHSLLLRKRQHWIESCPGSQDRSRWEPRTRGHRERPCYTEGLHLRY